MKQSRLDKDMISQPQLWRLVLVLLSDRLDVALFPPLSREEMIWRSYRFDESAPSTLKALEDLIYDNPLLLSDFKSVTCVVGNCPWLMAPIEASDDDCVALMSEAYPQSQLCDGEVELCQTSTPNAVQVMVQRPDIKAFLRRTFYNIRFTGRMAELCRYLAVHIDGLTASRMYVVQRGERLLLMAFNGAKLLMANEFHYQTITDAAYYVLASLQHLGMDASASVALRVDDGDANELSGILKRYLHDVRPIPFPALRYRASKNTLQAPFEVIIQSLCE